MILGVTKFTVNRWVKQGRFPPPIRLSEKTHAWRVADIEAWLAQRSRSRKQPTLRGALMQGPELVRRSEKEAAR
ncbi:MAG: AlpA family phage regulatory protein [Gammaproteobacteria bacterium]|nr:AlpA family phage regulatory protein [Gammaproteobacteria bacterium]